MLRFFRSSGSAVIVTIILTGILTWLHVLFAPAIIPVEKHGTAVFLTLNRLIGEIPVLKSGLGLFCFLITAIIMIFVNSHLNLIDKFSYLPALCYVLLIGSIPEIHSFNPCIIATMLLISGFSVLSGAFENERLSYRFFTVSAFISFASFFYQYMYVYMLVVWCGLIFWRPLYWREWVFSILGFALPFFFAFSWFFLVENDSSLFGDFIYKIFDFNHNIPSLSVAVIFFSVIITALVASTFGYTLRYIVSKKATVRTGYYILFLIVIITVCLAFAAPDVFPQAWYILAFPLSFTVSCYLSGVRSERYGNIILAALFMCALITQIISLYAK